MRKKEGDRKGAESRERVEVGSAISIVCLLFILNVN